MLDMRYVDFLICYLIWNYSQGKGRLAEWSRALLK